SAHAAEYARAMKVAVLGQPGQWHRAWSLFLLDHGRRVPEVLAHVTKELETRRDIYGYDLLAWALHKSGRDGAARIAMARALALTGAVVLPTALIEFLIPLTIVATCVENLLVRDRARAWWGGRYRPVFAGVFGLVHGAGFANYLRGLFVAPIALPLFGFNLGIELGQIAVLALAAGALAGLDRCLGALAPQAGSPLRLRVVLVSTLVAVVAAHWAVQRSPW